MTRAALIAGLVVVIFAAGWVGGDRYRAGRHAAAERAVRVEQDRRDAAARTAEEARLAEERARISFDQSMEDAAHADPVRYPDALSADRMRRLRTR